MRRKICALMGYGEGNLSYAPAGLSFGRLKKVLTRLELEAMADGYDAFLCDFSRGVGILAAETVIALKKKHRDIRLIALLLGENQADHWSEEARERYFNALMCGDEEFYANRESGAPLGETIHNQQAVRMAERVVLVYNGKFGKTMHLYSLLKNAKREVIVVDPDSYMIERE